MKKNIVFSLISIGGLVFLVYLIAPFFKNKAIQYQDGIFKKIEYEISQIEFKELETKLNKVIKGNNEQIYYLNTLLEDSKQEINRLKNENNYLRIKKDSIFDIINDMSNDELISKFTEHYRANNFD